MEDMRLAIHGGPPEAAAVRLTTRHFPPPLQTLSIRCQASGLPPFTHLKSFHYGADVGEQPCRYPLHPWDAVCGEKRPPTVQIILHDFCLFVLVLLDLWRPHFEHAYHFGDHHKLVSPGSWQLRSDHQADGIQDERRLSRYVKKQNKTLTNIWLDASIDPLQTIHVSEGVFPLLKLTEAFLSKAGYFLARTQIRVISDDEASQPSTFLSQTRYVKIQKLPDCHGICQQCPCHPRVWFIMSAQGSAVSMQNAAGLRPCGRTHNNCHFCRNTNDRLFVMASFTYRKLKQCMFLLISDFSLLFFIF